jgi:hypothetical protein
VHDDAPQPRVDTALAAELVAAIDREREGILNRVVTRFATAGDRRSNTTKLRQTAAIHSFDLIQSCPRRGSPHLRT